MAATDVITDTAQEGNSNTYTIRPNFQHKYVLVLMLLLLLFSDTALNAQNIFQCRIFSQVHTVETAQSEVSLLQ